MYDISAVHELLASGQIQQALDAACDALKLDSENAELCNIAGICASMLGDAVQAERYWERAVALNPLASQSWFNLGLSHAASGRDDRALECYRQAIAADPGNAAAHSNLGLVLEKQRHRDEAEQCHRQAALLDKGTVGIRFNLANFLSASDRDEDLEEAKSIFIDVIKIEPTHFGAWNNLGTLLFETGYTSAARTAYSAAVTHHPNEVKAHVNLGNVLLYMDDLPAAEEQFNIALDLQPDLAPAHQGLASLLQRRGNGDQAKRHIHKGFGTQPVSTLAYRGRGEPSQLVILASALEGNIPWRLLIDSRVFRATIIAVEYFDRHLPPHQLIFNAIGDADLCHEGLKIANRLVESAQAPLINHPDAVLKTGRLANSERLASLPGVIAPRMALISRKDVPSGQILQMLAQKGFTFPLLFRAPGFHGGNHFVCIEDASSSAYEELPGEQLLAIEFLDSRPEDSLFRKYRVMSINGSLFPIHMAISTQWKVHYFSSDMDEYAQYRAEEEAFLNNFSAFIGPNATAALENISRALDLDYCGIDFGIDRNGNVLLYEANATMVINPPTHDEQWDYRRPAIEHALGAAKRMFAERAGVPFR
ncbi:MAG: hypothetical protein B7Z66_06470 [Chromatiales bacterium 21-64-14]|nr:MAG: hypothetical protein B7Z66_06470 [Chromatiales bacterium 21-64-14]HQU16939.1 tetratricopeptide repeat protein [Gammaproteobacteria bacterium]